MKNYFLILLLLVAGSAQASYWVKVYDQDGTTMYIDAVSIKKDDKLPIVWLLLNYNSRSPFGDLSSITQTEFDCKEERYRQLTTMTYSEPMAQGKGTMVGGDISATSLGFVSDWYRISPSHMNESVFRKVCGK